MENKTVYKVGDCLINKQTKQIIEITRFFEHPVNYYVKDLNTSVEFYFTPIGDNLINFTKLDISCPVAQILYSNKRG